MPGKALTPTTAANDDDEDRNTATIIDHSNNSNNIDVESQQRRPSAKRPQQKEKKNLCARRLNALKVVLPHVALVTFVCLYAIIGAWIFYSLESPHEDRLKANGVLLVKRIRRELAEAIWKQHQNLSLDSQKWALEFRKRLHEFNENLYKAYKEQYVRYGDIRSNHTASSTHGGGPKRVKRHWSAKGRSSERGGKLWTPSSSLFFAATTMATIGYGNIVPVTSRGRIACIVFALFGAPLAIITIGDVGKFLSECTIWFYQKMRRAIRNHRFRLLRRTREKFQKINGVMLESGAATDGDPKRRLKDEGGGEKGTTARGEETPKNDGENNWEDDTKTEVPVLLVFAILLIYIALGGVLFAFLESWTYMDSFYYCFVSLTTIGFGDLVPERHEYIVIILLYLGVGLAVTTMCIDLVGIEYVQKIHYFGRKFKGTDILQILRRKRMLERRFAMGEGKEFIEYMIQQVNRQENLSMRPVAAYPLIPPIKIASQHFSRDPGHEERISLQSEQELIPIRISDKIIADDDFLALAEQMPFPLAHFALPPIPPKSPPPTSSTSARSSSGGHSSTNARLLMYTQKRDSLWTESGPSPSGTSSMDTEASVANRELLYEQARSPQPSVSSFKFTFPAPSPDLQKIAHDLKNERRRESISGASGTEESTPVPVLSLSVSKNELVSVQFEKELPSPEPPQDPKPSVQLPPPNFGKLEEVETVPALIVNELELPPDSRGSIEKVSPRRVSNQLLEPPSIFTSEQYCQLQQHWLPPETVGSALEALDVWLNSGAEGGEFTTGIGEEFIGGEEERRERALATSLHSEILNIALLKKLPYPVIRSPSATESVSTPPVNLERTATKKDEEEEEETEKSKEPGEEEEEEEEMEEMEEPSTSYQPIFDLDLGGFELVDAGVSAEQLLSNEDPVIYHKDIPVHSVHQDTVQTETAIENLMNAPASMLSSQAPPTYVADNYCFAIDGDQINMEDILGDDQYWRHTSRPTKFFYSQDLKRFYRVNCLSVKGRIVSARLAATKPTMGGGAADQATAGLAAVISTPGQSFSSGIHGPSRRSFSSPRALRRPSSANPLFLLDTASPTMAHHTALSRTPSKGIGGGEPMHQFNPRESIQSTATIPTNVRYVQKGEAMDLTHVYKVMRIYSFWRTCTSFHRIVTLIERVGESDAMKAAGSGQKQPQLPEKLHPRLAKRDSSSTVSSTTTGTSMERERFKRRLFIQYLWKNVKANDKARVQREFDPRRQRLLQAVTDTVVRKRMTGAWRTASPAGIERMSGRGVGKKPPGLSEKPPMPSPSTSTRIKRTRTTMEIINK